MNDILDPPAERDLPAERSMRMRTDLLVAIRPPARRPRVGRRGLAMGLAAAVAVAGLAGPAVLTDRNDDDVEALAMSPTELSRPLREVTQWCLDLNADLKAEHDAESLAAGYPAIPAVTAADLAVAARRGDAAVLLFITPVGYFACDRSSSGGGGGGGEQWPLRDWLPRPVQVLSLTSSGAEHGGHVTAAGRISDRVAKLVLAHGDGATTTARVERGVFGLISNGVVTANAELVSYDRNGTEIDRFKLLKRHPDEDRCYLGPAGGGSPAPTGPGCAAVERWTR